MATAPTKAQLQAAAKKAAAEKKPAPAKKVTAPVAPDAAPADAGINLQHLTHIVTATTSAAGFCFSPSDVSAPLAAAGLVEVKADVQDDNGDYATRATDAGVAYVAQAAGPFGGATAAPAVQATWTPTAPVAAPVAPAVAAPAAAAPQRTITKPPEGGFKVVLGITPPPLVRSFGARQSVYPFDTLPVGGSFFVIATEQRPKPSKSLASTVNSAMARHAVQSGVDTEGKPVFTKTRQFSLRAVQADTAWPDGSLGGAPWGFPGAAGAMVTRTV